jgi:3-isopropylmalate/(R)-2-methylmalate dehydratase small subunit
MEKFVKHTGRVAPLDRANVDTDAILPKQYMKSISRFGFGANLFDTWRYLDDGEPGQDHSLRLENPDFVLNQPRFRSATILLARSNFGCGSSREHAPWALQQYGFRVIVAPSYADIFLSNCFKIGLLAVELDSAAIDNLFDTVDAEEGYALTVDLESQTVNDSQGTSFRFVVAPTNKQRLLLGLDDVGMTLRKSAAIAAFEEKHLHEEPWLK